MGIAIWVISNLPTIHRTAAYTNAQELAHIPTWNHQGRKTPINLQQNSWCKMGPKANLLLSTVRICKCLEHCGFMLLILFSAQQFNLFSQSYKVSMPGHCSLILSEMHILLAFLHVLFVSALEWQQSECDITQPIIECDWCVPTRSTINVTKLYNKVDSVILWFLNLSDNRNQSYEPYEK